MALGGNEVHIAPEFTYTLLAGFAAMMSFILVKQNVNFAFYFFVFNRSASGRHSSAFLETKEEGKYFTFGNLMKLLYLNFLGPIIIVILFVYELSGSIVVDKLGASKEVWEILRLFIVIGFVAAKTVVFREEMQFQFDQSYFVISKMMQDKDEKLFQYVQARVTQNFRETWYDIFQTSSQFIQPILLVICFLNRALTLSAAGQRTVVYDFTSTHAKIRDAQQGETPVAYDLFQDREELSAVISEVSGKGVIPLEYQMDFFNFAIFWHFTATFLIQAFALLYYRKYREN